MNSHAAQRWILKRETQAKIAGLKEAQDFIVKDEHRAFGQITARIIELEKIISKSRG